MYCTTTNTSSSIWIYCNTNRNTIRTSVSKTLSINPWLSSIIFISNPSFCCIIFIINPRLSCNFCITYFNSFVTVNINITTTSNTTTSKTTTLKFAITIRTLIYSIWNKYSIRASIIPMNPGISTWNRTKKTYCWNSGIFTSI